jgi:hypothetical protein
MLKQEGKEPLYINVAEAAVLDYPASHLEVDAQNFKFKTHLTADRQVQKDIFRLLPLPLENHYCGSKAGR